MRNTAVAALLSAAIAVSFFLPWLNLPFADPVAPNDVFGQLDSRQIGQLPAGILLFLISFALAGLVAVLALFGFCPRVLALAAALLPLGLIAYVLTRAGSALQRAGVPLPSSGETDAILDGISEFLQIGALGYAGGSVLLLAMAILDPGRDRR